MYGIGLYYNPEFLKKDYAKCFGFVIVGSKIAEPIPHGCVLAGMIAPDESGKMREVIVVPELSPGQAQALANVRQYVLAVFAEDTTTQKRFESSVYWPEGTGSTFDPLTVTSKA